MIECLFDRARRKEGEALNYVQERTGRYRLSHGMILNFNTDTSLSYHFDQR